MAFSTVWERNSGHFKQALRTGLAALICLYITKLLGLSQGYWAAVSSIIVLQSHMGATIKASGARLAATAIGAFVGALLAVIEGNSYLAVALAITLAILCCTPQRLRDGYRLAGATVVSTMLGTKFQSPWGTALERFIEVSLGIIVALILAKILWPSHARQQLRDEIQTAFSDLYSLYKAVIDRYLNKADQPLDEFLSAVRKSIRAIHETRQQAKYEPDGLQLPNELISPVIGHLRLVRQAVEGMELATRSSSNDTFQKLAGPELERLLSENSKNFEFIANSLWKLEQPLDSRPLTDAITALDNKVASIAQSHPISEIQRFDSFLVSLRSLADELVLTSQQVTNDQ
jgi:uncharacterized membrane protein YgaE (UPF0421/DUF939 family)